MRPEWDTTFINIAREMATQSTCSRYKVAAILIKNKRILSTGINGVPSGFPHCEETFYKEYETWYDKLPAEVFIAPAGIALQNHLLQYSFKQYMGLPAVKERHGKFSALYELHAEINAIAFAAKSNINIDGATLYCTLSPCKDCSKAIIAAGIKELVYDKEYDRDTSGLLLLNEANVIVRKYEGNNG